MCRCSWALITRVDNKGLFLCCRSRWSGAASERLCFTRSGRLSLPTPPHLPTCPPTPPPPRRSRHVQRPGVGTWLSLFPTKGQQLLHYNLHTAFPSLSHLGLVCHKVTPRHSRSSFFFFFCFGLMQSPLAACVSITAVWRRWVSVRPLLTNPLRSIGCPSVSPCVLCVLFFSFFLLDGGFCSPQVLNPINLSSLCFLPHRLCVLLSHIFCGSLKVIMSHCAFLAVYDGLILNTLYCQKGNETFSKLIWLFDALIIEKNNIFVKVYCFKWT